MKLHTRTNTYTELLNAFLNLYDKTTIKDVPIRRIGISLNGIEPCSFKQISLFENPILNLKEQKLESAILSVKSKIGTNSILKGINLEEGSTQIIRNSLIGGHNAN
jgi:DNA polymerase V